LKLLFCELAFVENTFDDFFETVVLLSEFVVLVLRLVLCSGFNEFGHKVNEVILNFVDISKKFLIEGHECN
jgi:hypothetical protein